MLTVNLALTHFPYHGGLPVLTLFAGYTRR